MFDHISTTQLRRLHDTLATTFGDEWTALSYDDHILLMRDCVEDGGVSDLATYRINIGRGNLASYVRTQRVRFARIDGAMV